MFYDFVFDTIGSDEYGVMCVSFESSGKKVYNAQKSNLQVEKTANNNIFHMISQEYSEPLEYTIQLVNKDGAPILPEQERELNRWLCKRGKYSTFAILDKRYTNIWFFANINNPKLIVVNDVVGMEYTVTTNAPFAFSDERNILASINQDEYLNMYVDNDEEIPIYPNMTITLQSSGDLNITNILDSPSGDNVFQIKNCVLGETITIDGELPLISSSIQSHNIYNDFNKNWFYLTDGYNTIHSDLPCSVQLKFREYRKVGIV